ncbi:MAG: hypothetical protein WBO34_12770 [Gammaproteobacteria bacterium]
MMQNHDTIIAKAAHFIAERIARSLVLTLTCLTLSSAAAQPVDSTAAGKTAEFTKGQHRVCLYCHNVERMQLIAESPHGKIENPDSPFLQHECESCHGPGTLHATRIRLNQSRQPMIVYGADSATSINKQSQTCLEGCHGKDMERLKSMEWNGSVHGRPWVDADGQEKEMTCVNCHKLHIKQDSVKDMTEQAKTCYKCHEKTEREHPRFEDKGIVFDSHTCWDCHDVHQLIYQGSGQEAD